jgi:DNA-binding PadR family transcriptional regulator
MHKHRTPEGLEEHAFIDRAVLNLMLDLDKQRPWAEDEIARAISFPGDVRDSLRRLRASRLIHRWNDLASASRPAVRYYEITQGGDPDSADERHHDKAVLEGLLVRAADGEGPRSEEQIFEAFGARKRKQRLAITDALNRLDEAGLIDRRGGRAIASEVARRLDELMTL